MLFNLNSLINRDKDEFSNLQLYKTRIVKKTKSAYYPRQRNGDNSDYEEYEDDEDELNDDKYCCDCPCCMYFSFFN